MYTAMSAQAQQGETGVGVSSCCISGKIHQGSPVGKEEEIGGLLSYVSPSPSGDKSKTIFIITDIFGFKLPNVRLLADEYAKGGFQVIIPDFHQGDSLPHEFLQTVEPPLPVRESMSIAGKAAQTAQIAATLGPWLIKHREAVTKPLVDDFVAKLHAEPGVEKVGVLGFCWGARYAILTTHEADASKGVQAAYACHPSLVTVPGDFEPIARPVSFALGEKDSLLGEKERDQIKEVLDGKKDVPHEFVVYDDQIHGFSLRGDWHDDKDKAAMDKALKQGVEWFKKYLS